MKDYILKHIKKYGNCYIPYNDYKKLGKKEILNYLKKEGYECEITKYKNYQFNIYNEVAGSNIDVIIDVIKESR